MTNTEFLKKQLKKASLIGATLVDVVDADGSPALVFVKGGREIPVVVLADEEGNGPGWLEVGEFERTPYDADCPACLRGRQHSVEQHNAAVERARRASLA